jgi:hypothetical protein
VGNFEVVALEILDPPAHVEREIEHPLLVVALGSQVSNHWSLVVSWLIIGRA